MSEKISLDSSDSLIQKKMRKATFYKINFPQSPYWKFSYNSKAGFLRL